MGKNRPLSLGGLVESRDNKKHCFRIEFASGRGLPCENKAFYSPETQHGSACQRSILNDTKLVSSRN